MFSTGSQGYDDYLDRMNFTNINMTFDNSTEAFATIAPTEVSTADASSIQATQLAFHVDILLVFVGVVFMVLIRIWLEFLNSTREREAALSQSEQSGDEKGIRKLTIGDWISLYNKTFLSNPHRMVLTKEHILSIQLEDAEDCHENVEQATVARDASKKNGKDDFQDVETGRDCENTKCHVVPSSSCQKILEALTVWNQAKKMPLLGETCVICFEDFQPGDEVVWSSSVAKNAIAADVEVDIANDENGCQHVYHQDCMVQYLANHSHRKFHKLHPDRNLEIETPCPTCRRNFCAVAEEDLTEAIQTRCLAIEETSSSSGSSEEEEEEEREEESVPN